MFQNTGFDSRWEQCKNRGSRPSQVNGGAVSKWLRCRWDVKHNQPTNQKSKYIITPPPPPLKSPPQQKFSVQINTHIVA